MRKTASLLTMLMLCCALAFAQTRTVTGQVRDADGKPIPHATVAEAGKNSNAVQADDNGNFTITVGDKAKLRVSAVGFENVTTSASSAGVVSLARQDVTESMVVVTTYGNMKKQKKETGFATTNVSAKELTTGRATNIGSALSGKVPGMLVVQPSSGVNNDVRVTIRGNRSLTGNNQPILVVDGNVLNINYLNQISPNDVESITVLKGPSSAALYGSEGSNGAIVVTTKRGNKSNSTINVSSSVQLESISLMPELQNQFGSYGGEGVDPLTGASSYIPYENQSYGPRYNGQMVPIGNPVRIFNADGTYHDTAWMAPYSAVKNGKRDFFNTGVTLQNSVNFSTGDATSLFYVSAENMKRTGTLPDDKSNRNSIRFNASKDIRKVTIGFNVNYVRSTYDIVGPDVNQNRSVYWSVLNAPAHVPLKDLSDIVNNPFATPSGYFNAYYGNPWWAIKNSRQNDTRDNIIASTRFEYRPLSWMSVSYNVSYNGYFDQYVYHRNSIAYTQSGKSFADNGFTQGGVTYPASGGYKSTDYPGLPQTGYREQSNYNRLQGDLLVSMKHSINKFTGTLNLGQSTREINSNTADIGYDPTSGTVNTYDNVSSWGPNNATGGSVGGYSRSQYRVIGAFADLTLGYNGFFFLHGTARNDWDSRLEKANRSIFYPGVDAAFIFTDAIPALKGNRILSTGKLRASYATTAQISVAPYSTQNTFQSASGYGFPYGSTPGYLQTGTFANPNIMPEKTVEREVGLELGWFKDRVLTDISLFQQNTTNQTLGIPISATAGRTATIANIGEVQNKGVELSIKGTVLQTRNVRWNVGVNYTYIQNKVLSIFGGKDDKIALAASTLGGGIYAVVGQPYPQLLTTDWVRDSAGRIEVGSTSGLPTKDPTIKSYGTTQPPYRLGLNTSVSWKGFTLAAVAEYRGGAVVLNQVGSDLDFTGVSQNSVAFNRDRFVIPNSSIFDGGKWVPNTAVVTNTDAWNFFGNLYNTVGSNYVTSADFWKLRELSLGYDLPQNFVRKTKFIKAANISLVGRDLFIIKAKENLWTDPEFSNTTGNGTGITTNGQTPSTRKYGVSLNLTF